MELNVNESNKDEDFGFLLASLTQAEAEETGRKSEVVDPKVFDDDTATDAADATDDVTVADATDATDATGEELDATMLSQLEATVARAELYETQTSTTDATPIEKTEMKKTVKKAGTGTKRTATPRKDVAALDDAVFTLTTGSAPDKTTVMAARPQQVKIAEKFDNLFLAIDAGKLPSKYVVTALNALKDRSTMTSAELMAVYKADGLKDGTASSQTGQIMALFALVGIAHRSQSTLSYRTDSEVARKILDIQAAQTA